MDGRDRGKFRAHRRSRGMRRARPGGRDLHLVRLPRPAQAHRLTCGPRRGVLRLARGNSLRPSASHPRPRHPHPTPMIHHGQREFLRVQSVDANLQHSSLLPALFSGFEDRNCMCPSCGGINSTRCCFMCCAPRLPSTSHPTSRSTTGHQHPLRPWLPAFPVLSSGTICVEPAPYWLSSQSWIQNQHRVRRGSVQSHLRSHRPAPRPRSCRRHRHQPRRRRPVRSQRQRCRSTLSIRRWGRSAD